MEGIIAQGGEEWAKIVARDGRADGGEMLARVVVTTPRMFAWRDAIWGRTTAQVGALFRGLNRPDDQRIEINCEKLAEISERVVWNWRGFLRKGVKRGICGGKVLISWWIFRLAVTVG